MPRDTFNDGDILTDDLGRLWLVSALKVGQGLLMPELPDFLAEKDEKKVTVEGFEFDQQADGIAAEREACAKIAESRGSSTDETLWTVAANDIASAIRSRK